MKRIIWFVLVLAMTMGSVAALAQEISFEPVQVQLADAGLVMARPEDMVIIELSEDDIGGGACWAGERGTLYVQVDAYDAEGMTLEQFADSMAEEEECALEGAEINGISLFKLSGEGEDAFIGALVEGADGKIYQFTFLLGGEEDARIAREMLSTLAKLVP